MMDKKKRYQLTPPSDLQIRGLGLLTEESDFRLSWLINQKLSLKLKKQRDLSLQNSQFPVAQFFSFYANDKSDTHIGLVANRSLEGAWLTIYHQVDYLLILSGIGSDHLVEILEPQLKQLNPSLRGVFRLDPQHLTHIVI